MIRRDDAAGAGTDAAADEPLSVRVDAGRGRPMQLFVLTRARNGLVEVREFLSGCAPLEYTSTGDELLATFERAHRDRRGMSESLYGIRLWLDGLSA